MRGDATAESLANLRPAFNPDGTVTAGNASQITDGAAAVVVVSQAAVERMGLKPLARIESTAFVAGPDVQCTHNRPMRSAVHSRRPVMTPPSCRSWNNEAFASVSLHSAKELGVELDRVNPRGGAIALGHPIELGTRIVGTLARQLAETGVGSVGAAGICGGGGQGSAIILRAV